MAKDPNKEYLINFGENLRKKREAKNLTQRELASFCTIDHSNISKMERGEKNITLLTLKELADALEIKAAKLLDFE